MTQLRHRHKRSVLIATTLLLALPACVSKALAQTPESLQSELATAEALLLELDAKAQNCMGSFSMNLGEAAALLCDEFLRAIDGEILSTYITHCKSLRTWRDQFIADQKTPTAAASNGDISAEDALDLLVNIEFNCAENALQERTRFVVSAFDALQQGTLLNQTTQLSFERRLAEIEFQTRLDDQGENLQKAIRQQGQRSQQSVQEQTLRLESELIRQQINNPR